MEAVYDTDACYKFSKCMNFATQRKFIKRWDTHKVIFLEREL